MKDVPIGIFVFLILVATVNWVGSATTKKPIPDYEYEEYDDYLEEDTTFGHRRCSKIEECDIKDGFYRECKPFVVNGTKVCHLLCSVTKACPDCYDDNAPISKLCNNLGQCVCLKAENRQCKDVLECEPREGFYRQCKPFGNEKQPVCQIFCSSSKSCPECEDPEVKKHCNDKGKCECLKKADEACENTLQCESREGFYRECKPLNGRGENICQYFCSSINNCPDCPGTDIKKFCNDRGQCTCLKKEFEQCDYIQDCEPRIGFYHQCKPLKGAGPRVCQLFCNSTRSCPDCEGFEIKKHCNDNGSCECLKKENDECDHFSQCEPKTGYFRECKPLDNRGPDVCQIFCSLTDSCPDCEGVDIKKLCNDKGKCQCLKKEYEPCDVYQDCEAKEGFYHECKPLVRNGSNVCQIFCSTSASCPICPGSDVMKLCNETGKCECLKKEFEDCEHFKQCEPLDGFYRECKPLYPNEPAVCQLFCSSINSCPDCDGGRSKLCNDAGLCICLAKENEECEHFQDCEPRNGFYHECKPLKRGGANVCQHFCSSSDSCPPCPGSKVPNLCNDSGKCVCLKKENEECESSLDCEQKEGFYRECKATVRQGPKVCQLLCTDEKSCPDCVGRNLVKRCHRTSRKCMCARRRT